MVACQVAHSLFNVPIKIARVRNRNYLIDEWKHLYRQDHLPIDVIISPEIEVAAAILRRLHAPGALDMIPFVNDTLHVLAIRCMPGSVLNNLPIKMARKKMEGIDMSLLGIIQGDKFTLPSDNIILNTRDTIYLACTKKDSRKAMALLGHEETEARRLIILGGGNVGLYIAQALENAHDHPVRAKLIELSRERAEHISDRLEKTMVVQGSGLDREILSECSIEATETIICVSNDDKVNILAALQAKRQGCQHAIALINNYSYTPMLGDLGIDITVNPRETTVSGILQQVRRGKIRAVHSIHDGAAEIIEAEAIATSPLIGQPISSIDLPRGVRIGAIMHDGQFLPPQDDTIIHEGDHVLMVTTAEAVKKVEKFFSVSLDFF